MSVIFCSTKLSSLIGPSRLSTAGNLDLPDRLYGWNAQIFSVHRRKCLIVTNKATLYSFIRLDLLKKDFSNLADLFSHSLLQQLIADNLYDSSDFWKPFFSDLSFCTTDNDKKVIGSMNDLIFQLKVAIDHNSKGLGKPTDTNAASYLNTTIMGLIKFNKPIESLQARKNNA